MSRVGRSSTAWQDMMICEITQLEGVAHLAYALDITDYVSSAVFAADGLRNFFIREGVLYLSSVYYGQFRPDVATLHIIELDAAL